MKRVCTKRPYKSIHQARQAHARAHWRLRVYWCQQHRALHVTNTEKRS